MIKKLLKYIGRRMVAKDPKKIWNERKKQEIVRLEVAPKEIMVDNLLKKMEQNACLLNEPTKDSCN